MNPPKPFVALLLAWIALCGIKLAFAAPDVWQNDASGYYAWAQSLVVDVDLDPTNQLGEEDLPRTDVGGREVVVDKYPAGWSLAALPGMALGQAGCAVANRAFGADYALDGLDAPVVRLTWAGVFVWTLLGLLASFSFVRAFTDRHSAAWGCAVAWLGTSAFAYTWKEPMMAHALCLTFVALSYELCRRWSVRPTRVAALAAGAAAGMLLITRPVNLALLVPLVALLWPARSNARPAHVAAAGVGIAVPVLAQLLVWRSAYGVWLFDGYAYTGEGFAFAPANVLRVLAGSAHGLLFRHPVTLIALIGLFALGRRPDRPGRAVAGAGLAAIAALVLLYGSWWSWGLGWSHGARWATDAYPLWALGIAAWLSSRPSGVRRWALLLPLCLWSATLVSLQVLRLLPMTGPLEVWGVALP